MSPPRIVFLADVPAHVDTLADWHHAEWQAVMPGWSRAQAGDELRAHAHNRERPTTLVMLQDDELLGSVSLVDEDEPAFNAYGEPWLASLYVRPDRRGRGHGAALVKALMAHAASLGIERLYLFTPGQADFYAGLGWRQERRLELHGVAIDLMSCVPVEGAG